MKFSVLMSVYINDTPKHLKEAIDSITINQTVKPNEIVIVVDGEISVEVKNMIQQYEKEYDFFRIVYLEKNVGLGEALKIGLEHCSYNIVARMDSDDISTPTRFEEQLKEMKKDSSLDLVGGQIYEFIDNKENVVSIRNVPLENKQIYNYAKKRCPFNHVTVMFKKDKVLACGGYISWYSNEDYYLWIRMIENKCQFKNIDKTLCYVRVGKEMYKRRGGYKYFKSEYRIQKYMLDKKIIDISIFSINIIKRFIIQVILTNKLRGFVFKKLARNKYRK